MTSIQFAIAVRCMILPCDLTVDLACAREWPRLVAGAPWLPVWQQGPRLWGVDLSW